MNWPIVGLVIAVVIFVYILYYFSRAVSLLQGVTALNVVSTIPGNKMEISSGKNVYYDFWIFVVNPPAGNKVILSREFTLKLNGSTLKVYRRGATKAIAEIPNFPANKWMFVAINVNEKVMEVYFNGKLVKTASIATPLNVTATTNLVVGSSGTNAYITKLRRLTKTMTSDFVWTKYLEGNGQFSGVFGSLFNYVDSYNAKITLTNGDKKKEMKIF
jgi:hypothetical protein